MRVLVVGWHIRRVLRVVYGWLRDVCVSIDVRALWVPLRMALRVPLWVTLRWPIGANLRSNEIRTHSPHVIAGARPGTLVRLWGVSSLDTVEDHPIRYRRRC